MLWHPGQEISDRLEEILAGTIAGSRPQERSIAQGDAKLAVRLARAGYELLGHDRGRRHARDDALLGGARRGGRGARPSSGRSPPTGDDQPRLAVALAEVTFWGEHRHEDAIAVLSDAAADAVRRHRPALLAELTEKLAGYELNTVRASAAPSRTPSRRRPSMGEELAASFAAPAAAASLAHLGRCAEALELIDRALPAAFAVAGTRWRFPSSSSPAPAPLPVPDGSRRLASSPRPAGKVALSIDSRDGTALFGVSMAEAMLRQGRPASAARVRSATPSGCSRTVTCSATCRGRSPGCRERGRCSATRRVRRSRSAEAERAATGTRYFDVWRYRRAAAPSTGLPAATPTRSTRHARGADWARRAGMPVEEALLASRPGPDRSGSGVGRPRWPSSRT